MVSFKKRYYIFLIYIALILGASGAFAVDDGLSFDKKIEGKYVTVYCAAGLDPSLLAERINIRPSDRISAGQDLELKDTHEDGLAQTLDTLFLKVSDILEMRIYSLKVNIKILKDNAEVSNIYSRLFNASLGGRASFYAYDFNSIYISEDVFKPEVVGHEMAHAIICHYFPTVVPVKIQELLAMYTEYSLRCQEK